MGKNLSLLLTLTSLVVTLFACAPKVPIPVLEYRSTPTLQQPNLLVLLRGRGGSYLDFERYGIIEAVREHNLPFDIAVPDAHFGYYLTETLHERLKFDIIDPAREQGYRQIWLAGFSMGGIGALFYPISYPDEPVAGLLLSSPFLGDGVVDDIVEQGGIAAWSPPQPPSDKWQDRLWSWVKQYQTDPKRFPPIFLGYAEDDVITGQGPALLATALPEGRVFSLPGDHDYPTFQAIWREQVERLARHLK